MLWEHRPATFLDKSVEPQGGGDPAQCAYVALARSVGPIIPVTGLMSRDKKLEPTQPYAPVEKMENNTEIVKLTQRVTTLEEEVGELKRMYHDAFRTKPTTTAASKVAKAASNIVPTVPKETGNQKQSAPVKKYVSIDVECVATGPGHNDRAPCSVAIVDLDETELLNAFFRPTIPIFSYLTELTGIQESDLVGCGDTLEDVRPLIAKCLGPDTVIVGQNPQGDIEWLNLKEGIDYDSLIDLSVVFEVRCWLYT